MPASPSATPGETWREAIRCTKRTLGWGRVLLLPREGMSLQFRAEAFNLFNKTNFRKRPIQMRPVQLWPSTRNLPGRQIQFALRLVF